MTRRATWLFWLAAAWLGAGGCSSMPMSMYPHKERLVEIRWTSHVPLKDVGQLKNLDALLEGPPAGLAGGAKLTLIKADKPDVQAGVTTCKQYLALKRLGYVFKTPEDNLVESSFKAATLPLSMLAQASPSRSSFLKDFSLAREGVASLPAALGLAGGEGDSAGKSRRWIEAFPGAAVQAVDADSAVVTDEQTETRLPVLAFADFNHAGVEDVLLSVTNSSRTGPLKLFRYVVLTRKAEAEPLTVIHEES
ncbi:MAG: hypothetical protein NT031_02155 [Planctomycetota bacterium]|nr:hypothetical protein [Planctomycetota bacterium]